jgi:hypothetical protein
MRVRARARVRAMPACMLQRALMTAPALPALFATQDGYIMRWQRFMILVTLVLSTLLTSIW